MCGFVGFANVNKDISKDIHIIKDMNLKLQKKVPDEEDYFCNKNINLGHRNLIITNVKNNKQIINIKYDDTIYTIVYNGQVYNKDEIKEELKKLGYEFERIFRYRSFIKGIYSLWYKHIS